MRGTHASFAPRLASQRCADTFFQLHHLLPLTFLRQRYTSGHWDLELLGHISSCPGGLWKPLSLSLNYRASNFPTPFPLWNSLQKFRSSLQSLRRTLWYSLYGWGPQSCNSFSATTFFCQFYMVIDPFLLLISLTLSTSCFATLAGGSIVGSYKYIDIPALKVSEPKCFAWGKHSQNIDESPV